MVVEIGVFNATPVYAVGLTNLSGSRGYKFEWVDDLDGWSSRQENPVVLIDIRSQSDLRTAADLTVRQPGSVVVVLIDQDSSHAVSAAIASGAAGVLRRDASPAEVILTLNAALNGKTLLPIQVARLLAASQHTSDEPAQIQTDELEWLESLARSATVAELGEEVGYSEREMYRRLKKLYAKMGVRSRTEALLKASRLGWIGR